MISFKSRESKRGRLYKMSRNLERLYKENKCQECKVILARMDFAKILGKFTKVKIQYESSSPNKVTKNTSSSSNSRLKLNGNGTVLASNIDKKKQSKVLQTSKQSELIKDINESVVISPHCEAVTSNVLKENNGINEKYLGKEKNIKYIKKEENSGNKQYKLIFTNPDFSNNNNEIRSKLSLVDLLPALNKAMLPSEEWCIDYFPKNEEPKDDKVYDRIAAELEDLMYNKKSVAKLKPEVKVEEFPSIMDILNDNNAVNDLNGNEQNSSESFKTNIESSDVEAMLLGKSNIENKDSESTMMEVDSAEVNKLIEDMDKLNNITDSSKTKDLNEENETEKLTKKPSILDEALQKGIEEHLPNDIQQMEVITEANHLCESKSTNNSDVNAIDDDANKGKVISVNETEENDSIDISVPSAEVTHVVFKKILNGTCLKSVMCTRNLKYSIELQSKSVEFIGAPRNISSVEDLQILLHIVNESELESLHVITN